ncbi:MAG: hypothetical protein ACKVW3_01885 [Phycisphaerales bacterium]
MSQVINAVYQLKITGPTGTVVYVGGHKVPNPVDAISAEASAATLAAEPVIASASTVINSPTAAGDNEEQYFARVASTASVGLIGVALENINAGRKGLIAGAGCSVPVRTTGTAVLGRVLNALNGAAGQVGTAAAATGAPTQTLGICIKANASIGGVNIAGVLVAPA